MYGRTGCQLVKELACVEKGHLPPYNNTLFEEVIQECNEHHLTLQSLIRKMQDERLDVQTARNADHYGALVHHLSILRNKRSLMAYMYNRVEVIRSFRWKLGPVLPEEILGKLDKSEEIYFEKHSSALEAYMEEVDLDLTVDTVPPKDPYIHVRVLDDIGEAWLSDRFVNLARHSMHFLKRTDAEQYISRVGDPSQLWMDILEVLLKIFISSIFFRG